MPLTRRAFVQAAGTGLAALAGNSIAFSARDMKYWVWIPNGSATRLSSDWQTQYLRTWQFVAARFRDDSGVAGYDIINEPHAFPLPPFRFDKDDLFPFYARAITA